MSNPAADDDELVTVEQYLQREEGADVRHEYVAGRLYAMSGGTLRHNTIALNLAVRLRSIASSGNCRVFVNDVKVRAAADVFYYPDLLVSCGANDDMDVFLRDPCLIVEVTSPSTARTDNREKLIAYRTIPSLQAYMLVSQSRHRVDVHVRDESSGWKHSHAQGMDTITVPCPSRAFPLTMTLDDIYEGVTVPNVNEPQGVEYGDEHDEPEVYGGVGW